MAQEFTHVKDWKSSSEYVDIDTGEIITKRKALRDYQILNKSKKVEINKNNGTGLIRYTNECRKSIQLELW